MSAIPEGWKLVPFKPNQDMVNAAKEIDGRLSVWKWADGYAAMLSAAPQPPVSHASKELTEAQVADACLSYRHDFGLMSPGQQSRLMFQCREWHRALSHAKPENQAEPNNGEPIYQCQLSDGTWIDQKKTSYDYNVKHGQKGVRVLYTAPQPTKRDPLTDEQIDKLRHQSVERLRKAIDNREKSDPYLFARLIERAHGIGGEA
jgi:hypothetical protein